MKALLLVNLAVLSYTAGIAGLDDKGTGPIAGEHDQSENEARNHKHLEICILLTCIKINNYE